MATVVNNAEIKVTVTGAEQAKKQISGLSANVKGLASSAAIAGAAYIALKGLFNTAIKSAEIANEGFSALRKIQTTLNTTGRSANIATQEMADLANQMMSISDFDDEKILEESTNQLLRYTSISKSELPRVQKMIVDLSAQSGDLAGMTKLVGMSMENPILGLTRLRKAGVIFSDTQQEIIKGMVEQGKKTEAASMLLSGLEERYAGAATAGQTASGTLKNAWEDYLQFLGTETAPVLNGVKVGLAQAFRSMTLSTNSFTQNAMVANLNIERSWAKFTGKVGRFVAIFGEAVGNVAVTIGTVIKAFFDYYVAMDKFSILKPVESFNRVSAAVSAIGGTLKNNVGYWKDWAANASSSLSTIDYETDKYYNNQIANIKKTQAPAIGGDDLGAASMQNMGEAAQATADAMKELSADLKEYFLSVDKLTGSGSAYFDELAQSWENAERLAQRSRELKRSADEITDIYATRDAEMIMIASKYYEQSIAGIKANLKDETSTIDTEYNNRLNAFDTYAQTARSAAEALHRDKVFTDEQYQKALADIEAMGVKTLDDANAQKLLSTQEYNQRKRDLLLETSNTEFSILQQLGMSYEQYTNYRKLQIEAEKQAYLDKKVAIEFVTAWEKNQLNGLAEEYKNYVEQTKAYTESFAGQINELGKRVKEDIASGFGNAFADALVEGKNFFDSMQKLMKDLVKMIIAELAKLAILAAFKSILGVATGGVGSVLPGLSINTGLIQQPSYVTPIINTNSIDRRLDRLAIAIENNKPQIYTQVIEGVPFRNAMRRAELQANVL